MTVRIKSTILIDVNFASSAKNPILPLPLRAIFDPPAIIFGAWEMAGKTGRVPRVGLSGRSRVAAF